MKTSHLVIGYQLTKSKEYKRRGCRRNHDPSLNHHQLNGRHGSGHRMYVWWMLYFRVVDDV